MLVATPIQKSPDQVLAEAECTAEEGAVLTRHGWPWNPGYWPTIRIEMRPVQDQHCAHCDYTFCDVGRGVDTCRQCGSHVPSIQYTPSCDTVEDAQALRRACVKLGLGYFDGDKTFGRKR